MISEAQAWQEFGLYFDKLRRNQFLGYWLCNVLCAMSARGFQPHWPLTAMLRRINAHVDLAEFESEGRTFGGKRNAKVRTLFCELLALEAAEEAAGAAHQDAINEWLR